MGATGVMEVLRVTGYSGVTDQFDLDRFWVSDAETPGKRGLNEPGGHLWV